MGNQSSAEFGGLYIRTDKPYYFSGELVTGNIYLNIHRDGFPGQVVQLVVSGKEKCKWEERRSVTETEDGKSVTRTEVDRYEGKNQFYCHRVAVHTFQTASLPRGQYTIPFQFTLFSHLPGSFTEKGNEYQAKITYKVKGQVMTYNKNFKPIKDTQEMIVREPLKTNIQAMYGEMEVKAKTWCCVDQGVSHIKCVFDKNNYLPGDTAFLWVDVDNSNCDLDVKEIRANLTNYLTLREKHGREKVITRNVVQQSIEGISSRSTAINDNRKQMQMMLNDLNSQSGLKPSTNGQIIRSNYELSATAVLSGCTCCNAHPSVKVPIMIVAPVPISYNQPIQPPPDWNPQVFQPQLVQFTDKDIYVKNDGFDSNFNYPSQNPQMNQMQQPYMQ